jgi:hypothetical protein
MNYPARAFLLLLPITVSQVGAQPLPVVRMEMSPGQLVRGLRDKNPTFPIGDCHALDLWECHPYHPTRTTDISFISLRWVQLDDDPELEAILITEAKAESTYVAYVFDKQGKSWNLVGALWCYRECDAINFIRVQKLTEDSPPLLLCYRDLGGSGSVLMTAEVFQLREGKLWRVFEIGNRSDMLFPSHVIKTQNVLATDHRLVIHTIREEPPGHIVRNSCEVRRWEAAKHTFIRVPGERLDYCDPKTGKPIPDKSFPTGLPVFPSSRQ